MKIKAEELKIDNYVFYKYDNICQVTNKLDNKIIIIKEEDDFSLNLYEISYDEIKPIPLNKELIERIGAIKKSDHLYHLYPLLSRKAMYYYYFEFRIINDKVYSSFIISKISKGIQELDIKYVHELQNLYNDFSEGQLIFKY